MNSLPYRQIRAVYDETTITVYQAYNREIAASAIEACTFVSPPFKRTRMTWIKPSFLWMMYRCEWARKDPDQHHVLAVSITRIGFEWALANSCLGHVGQGDSQRPPVRVQWDPERNLHFRPLPHRSIQIGLGGHTVDRYVDEWIVDIRDVTGVARGIGDAVARDDLDVARVMLPAERPYPLRDDLAAIVGADDVSSGMDQA